jgi:hypothetical protein
MVSKSKPTPPKPKPRKKALSQSRLDLLKRSITSTLHKVVPASSRKDVRNLTSGLHIRDAYDHRMKGKVYEASVFAQLCTTLHANDGLNLRLLNGTKLVLKQKGGPMRPQDPRVEVYDSANIKKIGEIWTDIEFLTLSYNRRGGNLSSLANADYHELDIAFVAEYTDKLPFRPLHTQILLGAECKCTRIDKDIVRALIGLRRELSYLSHSTGVAAKISFNNWPVAHSNPNSALLLYTTSPPASNYKTLEGIYDIFLLKHLLK